MHRTTNYVTTVGFTRAEVDAALCTVAGLPKGTVTWPAPEDSSHAGYRAIVEAKVSTFGGDPAQHAITDRARALERAHNILAALDTGASINNSYSREMANGAELIRALLESNAEGAALKALRLHVEYEALPQDRGGNNGPKGKAWAAFVAARDAALGKSGS